jgi:hypothetical protein
LKVLTSIPIQRVTLKLLTSTCGACGWICRAIILDSTHSLVKNQGGGSGDVNGRRAPVKPKKELPKKIQKAVTSSPGDSLLSTFVAIPFISGLIRVCGPLILCIRAFVRPFKALACMGVMWW